MCSLSDTTIMKKTAAVLQPAPSLGAYWTTREFFASAVSLELSPPSSMQMKAARNRLISHSSSLKIFWTENLLLVAYTIGDSNNNHLVFSNCDDAVAQNPDAHPLFHSDRGFQYTNRIFHAKIEAAGMVQSMSRVGKCLDNGPMEGFWGILKRERYYGRKFTDKETLMKMIEDYIEYYNNKRLQRNLGVLTPFEKYQSYLQAA